MMVITLKQVTSRLDRPWVALIFVRMLKNWFNLALKAAYGTKPENL